MAAPRLPFLWPFLYKSTTVSIRRTGAQTARRKAHSSAIRRQETYPQRYGTANEPLPDLGQPLPASGQSKVVAAKNGNKVSAKQKKGRVAKGQDAAAIQDKDDAKDHKAADPDVNAEPEKMGPPDLASAAPAVMSVEPSSTAPPASTSDRTSSNTSSPAAAIPPPDKANSQAPKTPSPLPDNPTTPTPGPLRSLSTNPLEAVLNLPSSDALKRASLPSEVQNYYHENASDPSEQRPPHISTPRYVHHFDTYSLVNRLKESGWTPEQAITAMKAVRLILADNIDLARDGLVSKSNVENEQYLFRAACSELRTEVGMRRKAETEKSRTERTQLQHEVDILGQRVGMETQNLKEELKGMVEGRKMAVREEGRGVESKIQELNYRITVALNSDSRSDVEGVRWLITKRAIAALAICVLMVLGSLRYSSSVAQQEEEARKRERAMRRDMQQFQGQGQGQLGTRREETEGRTDLVVGAGDPSFISLG
ncbi:hypothetical protein CAC42_1362 [Sphaceloma murrayae]|uniref:Uncharacterized protein n=1 Tax=Sphaceloma murrayae TaxID=2082308 RepID=A0A2K1QG57_9PEZI|nr:hypothetical protein CAC42_1362 [Sphaceloma murrayae]